MGQDRSRNKRTADVAFGSDEAFTIQKIPVKLVVNKGTLAQVSHWLNTNHIKPTSGGAIKNEAFWKQLYCPCKIFIDDLESASAFFGQLQPDVFCNVRNVRITVEKHVIINEPGKVLRVLQQIADSSPARRLADLDFNIAHKPCVTFKVQSPTKENKKLYNPCPCFAIQGFLGQDVSFLVRQEHQDAPITKHQMSAWLQTARKDARDSKVNFMNMLPAELREMVYELVIPTGKFTLSTTEYGVLQKNPLQPLDIIGMQVETFLPEEPPEEEPKETLVTAKLHDWQTYHSMRRVGRQLSCEAFSYLSRKNHFTAQLRPNSYMWYHRVDNYLSTLFQGFVKVLPNDILRCIKAIELTACVNYVDGTVTEPLKPLFTEILAQITHDTSPATTIAFACQRARGSPATMFELCATVRTPAPLRIKLFFQSGSLNRRFAYSRPDPHQYSDAVMESLTWNVRGYKSVIDLDNGPTLVLGDRFPDPAQVEEPPKRGRLCLCHRNCYTVRTS